MPSTRPPDRKVLEDVFNHIALPSRLPDRQDASIEEVEQALIDRLLCATSSLSAAQPDCNLAPLRRSLEIAKRIHVDGRVSKSSLLLALRELHIDDFILVHVSEQNAALIFRRQKSVDYGEEVVIEAFEASPPTEPVLASKGALLWDFPGSAAAVPLSIFQNTKFLEEVTSALEKASTESIKQFGPRAHKSDTSVYESRQTVDPAFITQLFMTLMSSHGREVTPILTRKRVRDDVCWNNGGGKPWRRSPMWLILRVAVQRHLCIFAGSGLGLIQYKFLMCLLLSQLLDDCPLIDDPNRNEQKSCELASHLERKLSGRLSKLEAESRDAAEEKEYRTLYSILEERLKACVEAAEDRRHIVFNQFKAGSERRVHSIQFGNKWHIPDLTLENSAGYLTNVMRKQTIKQSDSISNQRYRLPVSYQNQAIESKPIDMFRNLYFTLALLEQKIEIDLRAPSPLSDPTISAKERCQNIADRIQEYLQAVGTAYDFMPEQKSTMLLCVMDLWMEMDVCALQAFNLMKDYNPGFPEDILDVLHVARQKDMLRLHNIRSYLKRRHADCKGSQLTIFANPVRGCFAERYYKESPQREALHELHRIIEEHGQAEQTAKEADWKRKSSEFEKVTREESNIMHNNTVDEDGYSSHDRVRCRKCYLQRVMRRSTVIGHEHPLPSDPIEAQTAVFEIGCPREYLVYRNTTWLIISTLAIAKIPKHAIDDGPKEQLRDYIADIGLQRHTIAMSTSFGIASQNKSWLSTHFSTMLLPVGLKDLCHPNGLKLEYYDNKLKIWAGDVSAKPSFAHHCRMVVPTNSPFATLNFSPLFDASSSGPSSYEIISSQTKCPPGLNVSEYQAFQSLFSGCVRRWPQLLVELGSANLNFGTEASNVLLSYLALQVGPEKEHNYLGMVHANFEDEAFCAQLLKQVENRLKSISCNWREIHGMDGLMTIALRLFELSEVFAGKTSEFMGKVRKTTTEWMLNLKTEIQLATDLETAQRYSNYLLWAALLCRRTLSVYLDQKQDLDASALSCFIESSIALQDNMPSDPMMVSQVLKIALTRDLKMLFQLRDTVRSSMACQQDVVLSTMSRVLPTSLSSEPRKFSGFTFLPSPHEWWVQMTIEPTSFSQRQDVHFNTMEGTLLVMGKPVGKLPDEWRNSEVIRELFGNESLSTFSSPMTGMTYVLAVLKHGHEIHFGLRDKRVIVRAYLQHTVLEHIPREVFGTPHKFDLPASLLLGHTHWMDLKTGLIEIRPMASTWKSRSSNCYIDFFARRATRPRPSLAVQPLWSYILVDPYSRRFTLIANIFHDFEDPQHLTIWLRTSSNGDFNLLVELPRLELTFYLNERGFLECPQLRSEIDPDQDAGTWYGLQSKIVLREVYKQRYPDTDYWTTFPLGPRSILVTIGEFRFQRSGPHIRLTAEASPFYGRFMINKDLGRLECAPEPRLLYLKAAFHAYTSYPIPDPLTGRTGTEEAIRILKAGYCQPWAPITSVAFQSLRSIAQLTPRREYYPNQDIKVLQTVHWKDTLTTTIQYDGFWRLVNEIFLRSQELTSFTPNCTKMPPLVVPGDQHLIMRGELRRGTCQHSSFCTIKSASTQDDQYISRDLPWPQSSRANIVECVQVLRARPSKLATTHDLSGLVQGWSNLESCNAPFDKVLLTEILDLDWTACWGPLLSFCRKSGPDDIYQLTFLLATISFGNQTSMDVVRVLIAFTLFDDLKALAPPEWDTYANFKQNPCPRNATIAGWLSPYRIPFEADDQSLAGPKSTTKSRQQLMLAEKEYLRQQNLDEQIVAAHFLKQWPCEEPSLNGFKSSVSINVDQALRSVQMEWHRLFKNQQLSDYLASVQNVLNNHKAPPAKIEVSKIVNNHEYFPTPNRKQLQWTLPQLLTVALSLNINQTTLFGAMSKPEMLKPFANSKQLIKQSSKEREGSEEIAMLRTIVADFSRSASSTRKEYGNDLDRSLAQLEASKSDHRDYQTQIDLVKLKEQIQEALGESQGQLKGIRAMVEAGDTIQAYWQKKAGLWPWTDPCSVLECLRTVAGLSLTERVRDILSRYALSVTALQRLHRIEEAFLKGEEHRLSEEQQNGGHSNWSPMDYPDWILLEIDANILIRPRQVDVALATISPKSGSNSVLQLNMGQGKTSCIIPMVAAVLANGSNLMRVVVPKSLLLQTAQLLQARLGGLIGRGLTHIPFSRKTPTTSGQIQSFCGLHETARKSSGIIISLPEHLLSFQLSGLQRLSDGRIDEARKMIMTQDMLSQKSRDVIDECDSILALRTQLIYPSGTQKAVDGHPIRWEITEILLSRVHGHLENLQEGYPQSIEVFRRDNGGFPVIFFLKKDVENELISRLVDDIFYGRTSIFPPDCSLSDRTTIKDFISQSKVTVETAHHVRSMFQEKPALRQSVYLLRGLLVHRILVMSLKKRWNVQYGLHSARDPIAVPYHAKGTPSEQAEWGHPDVAISLTILAFYYDGLKLAHLRQALEHVLKDENDPSQAYSYLCQSSSLPDSLREWNSINVDDHTQLEDMLVHLRYNVAVIDYFLNSVVFPRHAKQFQLKLQASGWDLPLPPALRKSRNGLSSLTTGFSGTNDSKRLLPLTIQQHDLPSLSHTNAEVLTYLLQPRNRHYVQASNHDKHVSERELLQLISRAQIRILIDAGAQILEMGNLDLVKTWFDIDLDAKAAVYFDTTGRAVVVYRNNYENPMPLAVSPFADDLGDCLVYLDEAHTRGTDLKLPRMARGALTLGLGQTKDHTVQAAMRLRQLGTTQSITFFAPPEVHQSITDLRTNRSTKNIDSYDVICWLLEQTCRGIEQMQPLYYSQGVDFCGRKQAGLDFPRYLSDPNEREQYLGCARQVEQQTLEQLYRASVKAKLASTRTFAPQFQGFMQSLQERRIQFQDNGDAVHSSAMQEVEQEREVAHEVEVVREVQNPVHYKCLKYPGSHRDIVAFVRTGRLMRTSDAYELAFDTLSRLGLGQKYGVTGYGTSNRLFVSKEFAKTINVPLGHRALDHFQRPVQWVLWSTAANVALVVVPEEAEELLPLVKDASSPVTHMLTYAAPVTRKMIGFNTLKYYSMPGLPSGWNPPSWLQTELGIFSGRLYFDFNEYATILAFLGVKEDGGRIVERGEDGAIADKAEISVFASRPLGFLQDWLALRRRGQDFSETPMGYVCQGKPLHHTHHFFQDREAKQVTSTHVSNARENVVQIEDDKDVGHHLFNGIEFPPLRPSTKRAAARKVMFGDFEGNAS